jgi:hypothetical protein
LRLWQSDNPEALLAEKGPQGLLEDYLGEALDGMPAQLRPAAIALLAQMVTAAGTRNVISAGDLVQRVQGQEGDITPSLLEQALESLSQSRLVRRERRRDLDLYEIASEFLVPWISRRRDEFRQAQDRRRERRRLLILISVLAVILLAAGGVALYRQFYHAPLHVTGAAISNQTENGCGVNVTGRITTNGSAGTVSYQWVFQPQVQAPQPLSQSVAVGQHAVYVTVAVEGQGHGSASQKVTLQVLGPDEETASTNVVISC